MADGSTTTYSFTLPEVGASQDTWGTKLNANWSLADDLLDGTTAISPNLSTLTINSTAVTATAAELNILDGVTATATELNLLDGVTATTVELNYVDGVTSAIQTQIDAKLSSSDIGSTVQAFDADILKADTADTITAPMRGTVTADNDLSFDMNATNNFKCTPTGNGTLTFTNITAGQSGNIFLDNSGGHVISAAATVFINSGDLTTISTAGKYFVSYFSPDGTNVYVSSTPATTSTGA